LSGFDLIDGGDVSEKLSKIPVKFLKFYAVERLWNTEANGKPSELFQNEFSPEKTMFNLCGKSRLDDLQ
jgi:hypothetical protein